MSLAIKPEHLEVVRAAIAPLDTEATRARYRKGDFPGAGAVKDLDKRYRWDLFWAAGLSQFTVDTLYRYIADPHIDSALRSIVKPL